MDGARDVLNWRMLRKEIKEVEILHSRFLIDGNHTLRTVLSNGLSKLFRVKLCFLTKFRMDFLKLLPASPS